MAVAEKMASINSVMDGAWSRNDSTLKIDFRAKLKINECSFSNVRIRCVLLVLHHDKLNILGF